MVDENSFSPRWHCPRGSKVTRATTPGAKGGMQVKFISVNFFLALEVGERNASTKLSTVDSSCSSPL
jgi:hypothetical protein